MLEFLLAPVLGKPAWMWLAFAGVAALLIFIGGKVFVAEALGLEKFPAPVSLGITAAILAMGIGYSMWRTRAAAQPA